MSDYKQSISNDISSLNSYFFIGLSFFLPVSVAGVNSILVVMLMVFLWERNYMQRFARINSNPIFYIVMAIVVIHLIGCLWSDNFNMALETLNRIKKILYIPFLMMFIKREHILYYFQAFLLGMMISETLTYFVWLDILPPFMHATNEMPSPLMKHTYYTPYVAMAIGLLIYFLLYKEHKTNLQKFITIFFLFTMLVNISISGGRAGQVGFFVLFLILMLDFFKEKLLKGIILFSVISTILFTLAYTFVPLFEQRVDKAIYEVTHFSSGEQDTSLGIRMALNKNYFTIFLEHPWLGVGTGDYLDAYMEINKDSEYRTNIIHPHNMYLLIFVQFGIIGGIIFLTLFIYQLYYGLKLEDDLQVLRVAFPLFYLVIMFVNWYLYTFHTMYLFIFFTAILYHQYDEKIKIKKLL